MRRGLPAQGRSTHMPCSTCSTPVPALTTYMSCIFRHGLPSSDSSGAFQLRLWFNLFVHCKFGSFGADDLEACEGSLGSQRPRLRHGQLPFAPASDAPVMCSGLGAEHPCVGGRGSKRHALDAAWQLGLSLFVCKPMMCTTAKLGACKMWISGLLKWSNEREASTLRPAPCHLDAGLIVRASSAGHLPYPGLEGFARESQHELRADPGQSCQCRFCEAEQESQTSHV